MSPIHQDLASYPNPSLIVSPDNTIRVENTPIKAVGKGQVKIHIKCTGICGSDIHLWKEGGIGDLVVNSDLVLGHECSGQILEVGEGVTNVKRGDRVAIEPQVPCGICFFCVKGDYNLCEDVDFLGVPPTNGSMQRFLVTSSRFVFKLPDNMSYEEGALVEPLSVAYHGVTRAKLILGKGAVICGAGPIGLSTLLLAKASGATPLVITDISEKRLAFAQTVVPEVIPYLVNTKISNKENGTAIKKLFGDKEEDAPPRVLECTGIHSSINTAAYAVQTRGLLMVIGVSGKKELDGFPFMHLSLTEVDVRFINRYVQSWPPVINLISSGRVPVGHFVTHRFKLEDADKALECSSDPSNGNIKVSIIDEIDLM